MDSCNIYSLLKGHRSLVRDQIEIDNSYLIKKYAALDSELYVLPALCDNLYIYAQEEGDFNVFNGYYIGYHINQISKEFDLLRIGHDKIINIELKSDLSDYSLKDQEEKILDQMKMNFYYLNSLEKPIEIYTYVESNGLYKYNIEDESYQPWSFKDLYYSLKNQDFIMEIDLDKLFLPSNYLISPFNKTEEFIKNHYFLTSHQQSIKKQICQHLQSKDIDVFCISANAGTGKTLLIYDIAKDLMEDGYKILIVHGAYLNKGQKSLNEKYGWEIIPALDFKNGNFSNKFDDLDLIIVDEANRISEDMVDSILDKNLPVIFSYDKKQSLIKDSSLGIYEYISKNYKIQIRKFKLTNKIRTNKNMASFIENLFQKNKSINYLDYKDISIEYFDKKKDYMNYLKDLKEYGWTSICFTSPDRYDEEISSLASYSKLSAIDVVGQEFEKVACVLDDNFWYEGNYLHHTDNYYDAKGMLYQIVTRVISELKIIVYKNTQLYYDLLDIKYMDMEE